MALSALEMWFCFVLSPHTRLCASPTVAVNEKNLCFDFESITWKKLLSGGCLFNQEVTSELLINWQYYMQRCFPSSCHQVFLCVTDKGLGSFQSSFAPLLGDVKAGSLLLALLLSCTWVCLYSFRTMWYQKHQQLQGRTWRHSTKKFELSKLPRSAWLWKNTPCSKQYRELYWGVLSTEHQKWARVSCLSYWGSVGSVMFQFRANSSSVWSYWKCQDFLNLVFAFLVTTEGRSLSKHSQAFYKESQSIKLFLDLIF